MRILGTIVYGNIQVDKGTDTSVAAGFETAAQHVLAAKDHCREI